MKITKYEALSMIERGEVTVEDGLRLMRNCDPLERTPAWSQPCGGFAMGVNGNIR